MQFSKFQSSSNSIQFGSSKISPSYNNPEGSKSQFLKYPALSKTNLNLSGQEPISTFGTYKTRVTSPMPQSQGYKMNDKGHTRHATDITDSLQASKSVTDNSNTMMLELEFQISSLKNQNKRLRQELDKKNSNLEANNTSQILALKLKTEGLNQQLAKEKVKVENLISINQNLKTQNSNLLSKFSNFKNKIEQSVKKSQDTNKYTQTLKQQIKTSRIQQSQLQNTINRFQTDIAQANIIIKSNEERLQQIKAKEDSYKSLVLTMSQEKTLLNNRISQMIEQQAKLQNAEVMNRSQLNLINLQKNNNELTQEVSHLKKKINQILSQQESTSLKVLYENKIIILQKQIHQLKHRYQSPDSNPISHDKNEQQWKSIVEEKNREIVELKNMVTNLQSKISQLNKQLLSTQSLKPASSTHLSFQAEIEINNLKIDVKNLKRTLDVADQKLKYLISEGRKKDEFLKQYLSATVVKGQEIEFIHNFLKKYQIEIPIQGFSKISLRQLKHIGQLQQRVKYLSNRLYEKK